MGRREKITMNSNNDLHYAPYGFDWKWGKLKCVTNRNCVARPDHWWDRANKYWYVQEKSPLVEPHRKRRIKSKLRTSQIREQG